jgi:hypothetical protein
LVQLSKLVNENSVTITSSVIVQGAVTKQDCLCSFWPWLLITKVNIQSLPTNPIPIGCQTTFHYVVIFINSCLNCHDDAWYKNSAMSKCQIFYAVEYSRHRNLHCYVRHMEKMPSDQLICLNDTRGTEDVVNNKWLRHSVTMKTGESMENMDPCESRWPFMHQNDCRRVEHGQINSYTNFNNRFQHEQEGVQEHAHKES